MVTVVLPIGILYSPSPVYEIISPALFLTIPVLLSQLAISIPSMVTILLLELNCNLLTSAPASAEKVKCAGISPSLFSVMVLVKTSTPSVVEVVVFVL
jgi:hypothetical protein